MRRCEPGFDGSGCPIIGEDARGMADCLLAHVNNLFPAIQRPSITRGLDDVAEGEQAVSCSEVHVDQALRGAILHATRQLLAHVQLFFSPISLGYRNRFLQMAHSSSGGFASLYIYLFINTIMSAIARGSCARERGRHERGKRVVSG